MNVTRYEGRTGSVELTLPFRCARCGTQTSALVRTEGKQTSVALAGVGGSAEMAQRAAMNDAHRNAASDLLAAACPGCGELQPAAAAGMQRAAQRIASQAKLRWPVSIAATVLVAAVFGALGARDLAETSAGIVVAIGFALAAGAGTFAMYSWPLPRPKTRPDNVWFWWSWPNSAPAWLPPPAPRQDSAAFPSPAPTRLVSVIAAACAGLAGMVGLGGVSAWLGTVESVYVVTSGADADAIAVRVDGVETSLDPRARGFDVDYRSFSVRVGRVHRVEVLTKGGTSEARVFELDATKKGHGWLLMPFVPSERVSNDGVPCIVEEQFVYGDGPDAALNVLAPVNGVITLPRSYDRTFQKLPPFAATRKAGPTTKWAVRAVRCEALVDGELISFQNRPVGAK